MSALAPASDLTLRARAAGRRAAEKQLTEREDPTGSDGESGTDEADDFHELTDVLDAYIKAYDAVAHPKDGDLEAMADVRVDFEKFVMSKPALEDWYRIRYLVRGWIDDQYGLTRDQKARLARAMLRHFPPDWIAYAQGLNDVGSAHRDISMEELIGSTIDQLMNETRGRALLYQSGLHSKLARAGGTDVANHMAQFATTGVTRDNPLPLRVSRQQQLAELAAQCTHMETDEYINALKRLLKEAEQAPNPSALKRPKH